MPTLRLRLAMHLNIDATRKTSKTLNDVRCTGRCKKPSVMVSYINRCAVAGWGGIYMNASMESFISSCRDRVAKWYNTALLRVIKTVVGVPSLGYP